MEQRESRNRKVRRSNPDVKIGVVCKNGQKLKNVIKSPPEGEGLAKKNEEQKRGTKHFRNCSGSFQAGGRPCLREWGPCWKG